MTPDIINFPRSKNHQIHKSPIAIFIAVAALVGIFTYPNYGISWDEPYFYAYADAIPAAYSPKWNKIEDFVYGPSAEDHKYYGPAYLLLGKPIQVAVSSVFYGNDAQSWHLVNFLCFLLGVYLFYRLCLRLLSPGLSTVTAIFFATQPLLWGHAFINPKDIPFMVAFLAAIVTGLDWVDAIKKPLTTKVTTPAPGAGARENTKENKLFAAFTGLAIPQMTLAALTLGIVSAIRVIGPFAGFLVAVYLIANQIVKQRFSSSLFLIVSSLIAYALTSILVMFTLWPFLWADPVNRLLEVLRHMSDNPTELSVLFMGQVFPANEMPRRYFPQMLALTFTEPVWPLVLLGLVKLLKNLADSKVSRLSSDGSKSEILNASIQPTWPLALVLLLWFGLLTAYNTLKVPAMYDGVRHFFFIIPPVFLVAGYGISWLREIFEKITKSPSHSIPFWEKAAKSFQYLIILSLFIPSSLGILRLHPYEYTYYNSAAGQTFRVYERDFWLTCYREALAWVLYSEPETPLYIQREFQLAESYNARQLTLLDLRNTPETEIPPGVLLLFSTRSNLDQKSVYRSLPIVQRFGREGADFCLLKRKP